MNIISRGNVDLSARTEEPHVNVTLIRPSTKPQIEDDDYGDEEDDSYVYPRIAAKVIIADNKVAKAARAILKGDGEENEEETQPTSPEKVEEGKKGTNVEPANDQNNDPEIDDNLIKYLALMLLILLLIVIISGGIIINSKRKNQQISE